MRYIVYHTICDYFITKIGKQEQFNESCFFEKFEDAFITRSNHLWLSSPKIFTEEEFENYLLIRDIIE